MKRIGITGGIGSGKSEVTNRLRELGYVVIDADEVAREAAKPGETPMLRLREELGDEVFQKDGNLDRRALAKRMFYDPIVLMTVNEIFHEEIRGRMETQVNERIKNGDSTVFLCVPLLFESEADWQTDEVWLVTAEENVRLSRVKKRDRISEAETRARMENQMPEEEKRRLADVVIDNNGSIPELHSEIDRLLSRATSFSNR